MTTVDFSQEDFEEHNPLELVESIIVANNWAFERQGNNELTVGVEGNWCQYHLWFSWRPDISAVQFSCAYDLKIPSKKYSDIYELLARMNEQLFVGHFDTWRDEGMILYRHALLLNENFDVTSKQVEHLVEIGMGELEKFYPAIQFCLWGGCSPEEAIEAAMFETMGEA
ncbi:MAG: YbjN domain-containing protein [Sneathiella sp.]